ELLGADKARPQPPAHHAPKWRATLKAAPLSLRQKHHLRIYGSAIEDVLELGTKPLCEHAGAIDGEVRYVARNEHVHSLADIMMRRTGISWGACRGLCCAETVAAIAAKELGWKAVQRKREPKAFQEELDFHLPTLDLLEKETS
ncbi:MAG: glycerol-3-phosphate dehydrogenase C-terminal domain-containing protein, partial [Tepidiformaceae bacterium]